MTSRLLIIGGDSKVGAALKSFFPDAVATSRRASGDCYLDLMDPAPSLATLPQTDAVIICAAISGEAACCERPDLAEQVNVRAPRMIADYFCQQDCDVIYLTSDAAGVDAGVYASTKLAGEMAVKTAGGRILRLGKLLFPQVDDLFEAWARSLAAGEAVKAFTDRTLAPICELHLQKGVELFLRNGAREGALMAKRYVSYVEVAHFIADQLGADTSLIQAVAGGQSMMLTCKPSTWFDAPDPLQSVADHLHTGRGNV